MAILSVTPESPLLWAFLKENFNLGIAKMFLISENPLFLNPLLPKTSVNFLTNFSEFLIHFFEILGVFLDFFAF